MRLILHDCLKKNKKRPDGRFYSCAIAFTGHIAAHVPHEMHFVASIMHFPSGPTDIAPTGHIPIQL